MTLPSASATAVAEESRPLSGLLTLLFAAACGLIAANLYYAQPLAGPIGQSLGMSEAATGLVVTLTQIGYGLGLLFIVPLGDLVENRKLVLILTAVAGLAALGCALSETATPFLIASLMIGIGSVAVQVLVPFAAHLAPEASRGRVVGNVMSGLMAGIMLSRPLASFMADLFSWHAIFIFSLVAMMAIGVILAFLLPKRVPQSRMSYPALIASLGHLFVNEPVLRRRGLYQACLFAAFSLFWTVTPLVLAGPGFGLGQDGIALFALAGAAGAIASPIAGHWADKGWIHRVTLFSMLAVASAFLVTLVVGEGSLFALGVFVLAAIVLDFGVTSNLVVGQRAIYGLSAEHRSRINGIFMATFFAGGAFGSAVGGWAFAHGGWPTAAMIGATLPVLALAGFATERRG
ncbi:MFS transporter [Hoeflea sp. AS60]|uniref:MFS transporter n=1 Tax=Hoeflea sp. AS60 TaxID=3135780 RepID=UPI0031722D4E